MSDMSRGELNDLIAGFAAKNTAYRTALQSDAKDIIERQLNTELPASVKVSVVEDDATTMHIVLPHVPAEGAELSDADLESVAGGFLDRYTCNFSKAGGIGTRVEISLV